MSSDYWTSHVARARVSRRRVLRGGAGAVGVVSLGLAGCTSTTVAPTAAPAATQAAGAAGATAAPAATGTPARAPKYGGTVRTSTSSLERNLDPQALNGGHGSHGSAACYNQLVAFRFGPDVKAPSYLVGPDLAESWTQPDETTYIFKLRGGVKWHNIAPVNGRELVAEDITYSYDRIRQLGAYTSLLAGITRQEAVDRSTVRLTLDKPNPDLLPNLASYYLKIVAREAVAVNGNLDNGPTIGTGPWIEEVFEPGQRYAGKRNPDYFIKGTPYTDRFESLRFATDPTLNINGFRAGTLDIIGGTPDIADEAAKANPNIKQMYVPLDRSADELGLNTKFEPFRNKRVRQAVRKAIDWDAFPGLVKGKASISSGLSLPSLEWDLPQDELKRSRTRDLAGARQLLREAGLESGFEIKIVAPTYLQNHYVNMSELIQANLREINIRSTIESVDPATYFQRRANAQFDMYVANNGTLSATNADLYARYYPGGSLNPHGYDNPDLTRLIDQQAVQSRDPDARKKTLQDIQRIVVDDSILMNIMIRHQAYVTQPWVTNWHPHTEIHAAQYHLSTVWLDK
jgi:peptide/nickel transport system substrate-binding protein